MFWLTNLSHVSMLQLYVTAYDRSFDPADVRATTATVTVIVERNAAPQIQNKNGYIHSMSEGVGLDYVIMKINAIDPNPADSQNGMLVYRILESNATAKFDIDQSGNIRPRVSLNGLQPASWTFNVQVSDMGIPPMSDTTSVNINLQRIGGPRFNPSTSVFNKDENMLINEVLTRLQVEDLTPDGPIAYEIRGDGLGGIYFKLEMEGNQAVVKLNKSFIDDSNKTPFYKIRVQAYRVNNPNVFAEHIITCYVNRNPNAPVFNKTGDYVFDISENLPINALIGVVFASDVDQGSNGEVRYSIDESERSPSYLRDYFALNEFNGRITVIEDLTKDSSTFQYQFTVIASDRGVPVKSDRRRVTINVSRNPNPPQFINLPYRANLTENDAIGTPVIQVTARDDDGDQVFYKIRVAPPSSLYFKINNVTGQITTSAILYDDNVESHVITVEAFDSSPASRTASATVEIFIQRNPNGPYFINNPPYATTISEYIENGSPLDVQVRAEDDDHYLSNSGILRYAFESFEPPAAQDLFEISETTGQIRVATPLYGDLNNRPLKVNMTIKAFDKSATPKTATTSVVVNIVRNTAAPRFFNNCPKTAVANDRDPANVYLTEVSAGDPDVNVTLNRNTPNAQFEYSLAGGENSYSRFFSIRQDGTIYTKQLLNLPNLVEGQPIGVSDVSS